MTDNLIKETPTLLVTDSSGNTLFVTKLSGQAAEAQIVRDQLAHVMPVVSSPSQAARANPAAPSLE